MNDDTQNMVATTPAPVAPFDGKLIHPEDWRIYHYFDGYRIEMKDVTHVKVSPQSGNHRVTCAGGHMYIVSPGWRYIEFKAKDWSF